MTDNRDITFMLGLLDCHLDFIRNEIHNKMLYASKPKPMKEHKDGFFYCPGCEKMFTREHAADHPNFCENCGQAFEWPAIDCE